MDGKKNKQEKAFLIGTVLSREDRINIEEQFEELQALARTAGALTVGSSLQNRQKPDPSTFIGKGKVEEEPAAGGGDAPWQDEAEMGAAGALAR